MNELELWRCSLCKTERTWGQRTTVIRKEGVWLNCEHCRRTTLHLFTGEHKHVPKIFEPYNLQGRRMGA